MTSKEIEEAALRLPAADRERLAERLLASVRQEPVDPQVEAAWKKEIERRVREIDEGRTQLIPGKEVIEKLRKRFQ